MTSFAEACLTLSPQIMFGDQCLFIEIEACRKLYSESVFLSRLHFLLQQFGLNAKIAIENDIPTALSLAYFGKRERALLPIEALQIYASPLQRSKDLTKAIQTLKKLNIKSLIDLKLLPRLSIPARFGKHVWTAFCVYENEIQIPWRQFQPPEKIVESLAFEETRCLSIEPLLFYLKKLFDHVILRLSGRGHVLMSFDLKIQIEKYSTVKDTSRRWHFDLAFAQNSVPDLIAVVKERLSRELQSTPLESDLCEVEIEVLSTVPGEFRQKDFFSKKEEAAENVKALIVRLTERLGLENVFLASPLESYLPEKSWTKTLDFSQSLKSSLPQRPTRLMKYPLELKISEEAFCWRHHKWKVVEKKGPEKITGEWWCMDQSREYYRLKTDTHEELWVFKAGETYFLHGIFD